MSTQHEPLCKTDAGSHDDGVSRCLIVGDQTSALDCLLITMTLAPPTPLYSDNAAPPLPTMSMKHVNNCIFHALHFLIKLLNTLNFLNSKKGRDLEILLVIKMIIFFL